MAPIIKELVEEFKGRVKFLEMDAETNFAITGQYQIMSLPSFMLFRGEDVLWSTTGVRTKASMKEDIEKHI
jgi:thioredoxin 1